MPIHAVILIGITEIINIPSSRSKVGLPPGVNPGPHLGHICSLLILCGALLFAATDLAVGASRNQFAKRICHRDCFSRSLAAGSLVTLDPGAGGRQCVFGSAWCENFAAFHCCFPLWGTGFMRS